MIILTRASINLSEPVQWPAAHARWLIYLAHIQAQMWTQARLIGPSSATTISTWNAIRPPPQNNTNSQRFCSQNKQTKIELSDLRARQHQFGGSRELETGWQLDSGCCFGKRARKKGSRQWNFYLSALECCCCCCAYAKWNQPTPLECTSPLFKRLPIIFVLYVAPRYNKSHLLLSSGVLELA